MQVINCDLLSVTSGIVVQQINCRGVMGAGLAAKVRAKYPQVFTSYRKAYESGTLKLGTIQFIKTTNELYVCNLAGQDSYGRTGQHTNYDAVRTALQKLNKVAVERSLQVYIPYMMGCSLGGGDWAVVSQIISEECPSAIICKL